MSSELKLNNNGMTNKTAHRYIDETIRRVIELTRQQHTERAALCLYDLIEYLDEVPGVRYSTELFLMNYCLDTTPDDAVALATQLKASCDAYAAMSMSHATSAELNELLDASALWQTAEQVLMKRGATKKLIDNVRNWATNAFGYESEEDRQARVLGLDKNGIHMSNAVAEYLGYDQPHKAAAVDGDTLLRELVEKKENVKEPQKSLDYLVQGEVILQPLNTKEAKIHVKHKLDNNSTFCWTWTW